MTVELEDGERRYSETPCPRCGGASERLLRTRADDA
jgi:hypothetical protein